MKKEETLNINKTFWEKAKKKMEKEFKKDIGKDTDIILIISVLGLYKKAKIEKDSEYLLVDHPDELKKSNYVVKKVRIYTKILDALKRAYRRPGSKTNSFNFSDIINGLLVCYIRTPLEEYTDSIAPLYTIVGSKNQTMQKKTANAVEQMRLYHDNMTYIEGCCATGSLFFGLKTYSWKQVILNDMNPLRTNFLNVLLKEPLKLVKTGMEYDLSLLKIRATQSEIRNKVNEYHDKRMTYHKVDCNVEIACKMFILQCIDKAQREDEEKIFHRMLRFLPAHLKMINANTTITQEDCTKYLTDTAIKDHSLHPITDRLFLLDPPYIGSEERCSIPNYEYKRFHNKVTEYLTETKYPFIYYCRSSAPKSKKTHSFEEEQYIMKMELAEHFLNKGFYFFKVTMDQQTKGVVDKVTELMISNRNYDYDGQFIWTDFNQDIQ